MLVITSALILCLICTGVYALSPWSFGILISGEALCLCITMLHGKAFNQRFLCGASRCVSHGVDLPTPCEFERLAVRSTSRNWNTSIRFRGKPLSNFLKYLSVDKKKSCRPVTPTDLFQLPWRLNLCIPSLITSTVARPDNSPSLPDFIPVLCAAFN